MFDGVRLAILTGLRREDLISLKWDEINETTIVKQATKASRGKRRTVTIPRLPELDVLLDDLRQRSRKAGIDTVPVNSRGTAWSRDGFSHSFALVRDDAGIFATNAGGAKVAKHMHDLRGTFCTRLIKAGLTDEQVADIMGWAPEQVRGIRRVYVDQSQISVAIAGRLRGAV